MYLNLYQYYLQNYKIVNIYLNTCIAKVIGNFIFTKWLSPNYV